MVLLKGSCAFHLQPVQLKIAKPSLQGDWGAGARAGTRASLMWVCPGRLVCDEFEVGDAVRSFTQSSQRSAQMQNQHPNSKFLLSSKALSTALNPLIVRALTTSQGRLFLCWGLQEHQEHCWRTCTSQHRNVWQF